MWTSTGDRCGIATYTRALVMELQERGIEVSVVPVPYEERSAELIDRTAAALNDADVVHLQHEYSFFGGVAPRSSSLPLFYRALRKPLVVTAHSVFSAQEALRLPQENRWRQRLAKQALSALPTYRATIEKDPFSPARAVIVHTEEARERFLERGFPPERLHVLPAGTPRPSPAGGSEAEVSAFRSKHGLEGRRVLTIFGYVTPDKGYDTALDALASLPAPVKLLIAGGARVEREAAYLEELRGEIKSRGLSDRVAITGFLEESEIASAMGATDLVLVPHHIANGSYSVMVALAYGKPVLASDLACFREIAEAGGGVELFPAGDETMLAERIGFLLASQGARRELAGAAAAYAERRSWGAVAEQTLAIYRETLP